MNIIKFILIALGLFTLVFFAYFLIGIVSTLL